MKQHLVIRPLTAEVIPIEKATLYSHNKAAKVFVFHTILKIFAIMQRGELGKKAVLGTAFAS